MQSDGAGHEIGEKVHVNSDGTILMMAHYGLKQGTFSHPYSEAHLSGVALPKPEHGQYCSLLARYTPEGKNIWVVPFEGEVKFMAVNSKDEIYIDTYCKSALLSDDAGAYESFDSERLLKLDRDRHFVGMIFMPQFIPQSVAIDSADNLYVTGQIYRNMNFGGWRADTAKDYDLVTRKFSPYGNLLWENCDSRLNGSVSKHFGGIRICADSKGNAYVAGFALCTQVEKGIAWQKQDTGVAFLIKYNCAGKEEWSSYFMKSDFIVPENVAIDRKGTIFLSALFYTEFFTGGTGTRNTDQGPDIFIAKFSDKAAVHETAEPGYNETVYFKKDSSNLSPQSLVKLKGTLQYLHDHPAAKISCYGYTDKDASAPDYQQQLSEKRAFAVRDFLLAGGIDAARIDAGGKGSSAQIGPNDSEFTRQLNRRTDLAIR